MYCEFSNIMEKKEKNIPLFVHQKNDYTGSTRVLATLIETNYPHQKVRVICLDPYKKGFLSDLPNVEIVRLPFLTIFGKPIRLFTRLLYSIACKWLVKKNAKDYDIIYLNTIVTAFAAPIAIKLGKRIIWHIHEKFQEETPAMKEVEKVFNSTPAHRIFVSQYTKDCYPENSLCTYEICYNTLAPSFLKQVRIISPEDRDRKGVLMIASLTKAKGIDIFVEVAHQLPQFNFTLILSSSRKAISVFFENTEIPTNVTLLPSQSNIHSYLQSNSLILNLSNPFLCIETFGMTILEGMVYGLPAIVPNVGGPIELVENGYNGYCVDVTSVYVIKDAIISILYDKQRYCQFSKNSLKKFREFC